MSNPVSLPVLAALPDDFRQPFDIAPLAGGQSRVRLYRLSFSWGSAVLKGPLQSREYSFYQEVAPQLEALGIPVPHIMGWGEVDGEHWMLREDFPTLLPYTRLAGDSAVMAVLRRLHALPTTFPIPQPFMPAWQPIATQYQSSMPVQTLGYLARLEDRHRDLFTPRCVIAGDTNLPALSNVFHRYLSGYRDGFPSAGFGFGYTFPSNHVPWMRIDRILASGELSFVRFQVGRSRASDHLCVVADIARSE